MRNEHGNGLAGQDSLPRGVDDFLQIAMSLTQDERTAVTLMREAMAEAHRTWDPSKPFERSHHWLQEILTRRFNNGSGHASGPSRQTVGDRA